MKTSYEYHCSTISTDNFLELSSITDNPSSPFSLGKISKIPSSEFPMFELLVIFESPNLNFKHFNQMDILETDVELLQRFM